MSGGAGRGGGTGTAGMGSGGASPPGIGRLDRRSPLPLWASEQRLLGLSRSVGVFAIDRALSARLAEHHRGARRARGWAACGERGTPVSPHAAASPSLPSLRHVRAGRRDRMPAGTRG